MGQPDLMVRLSLKNYEDIKSRITYSHQLKPLSDMDLLKFIEREIEAVRLPKASFEEGALEVILALSGSPNVLFITPNTYTREKLIKS